MSGLERCPGILSKCLYLIFPLDKSAIWMLSFPHSHVHVYKACDRSIAKQYKGPFVLWRGRPSTPVFVRTS
jgi:hypothetical protein